MAGKRDTSKDGLNNKIQTFVLTNFKGLWQLLQSNESLKRKVNKALLNSLIYKIPTRPNPYSMMTLDEYIPDTKIPKKTDSYTSWESLNDRTYTGRHLPPDPKLNSERNLPKVEDLAVLFRKRDNKTIYSTKSTMLFPYWVQWFTDSFLRLDHNNKLKNTSNHEIDLCNVYGLTRKQTHLLRSFQGGKFKTQKLKRQDGVEEEYPLFYYADPAQGIVDPQFVGLYEPINDEKRQPADKKQYLFAMGVERANVQIGYVMLNTLCLREHNRLCDVLASNYPDWDDERLFQTSRNILMAIILKIIMEEYINHITPYHFKLFADPEAFTKESWHRPNYMAIEFDFVYRWHSAIPETFNYNGKQTHIATTLWNNKMLIDQGLGALMEETCSQPGTKIGLFNTPDILVELTELPSIRLGRQLQLASYNDYRELCGFPRVTRFEQITGNEFAQEKLKELYGHVDNIEFFVGLYAEDGRENSTIPALVARLIGIDAFSQALTNPLLSPNIFNKKTFSPVGWEIIQNTNTVSDLVNRNVPSSDKKYKVTFDL
ncbi:peroxidase family protein [Dendronalium sp. ChiSLP03b]|uniref:peroxidase family protein n=1 Tax=Dendronalium sp. ChiSLP03b TaxID=3075381 RepID=UPI002AD28F51|nr:peroxidase family protein [Dendronalium sp. ChiSLP03b]MDZ8206510.1 peroxidase family protein [Dendronalium sp. ChiSLP03b]